MDSIAQPGSNGDISTAGIELRGLSNTASADDARIHASGGKSSAKQTDETELKSIAQSDSNTITVEVDLHSRSNNATSNEARIAETERKKLESDYRFPTLGDPVSAAERFNALEKGILNRRRENELRRAVFFGFISEEEASELSKTTGMNKKGAEPKEETDLEKIETDQVPSTSEEASSSTLEQTESSLTHVSDIQGESPVIVELTDSTSSASRGSSDSIPRRNIIAACKNIGEVCKKIIQIRPAIDSIFKEVSRTNPEKTKVWYELDASPEELDQLSHATIFKIGGVIEAVNKAEFSLEDYIDKRQPIITRCRRILQICNYLQEEFHRLLEKDQSQPVDGDKSQNLQNLLLESRRFLEEVLRDLNHNTNALQSVSMDGRKESDEDTNCIRNLRGRVYRNLKFGYLYLAVWMISVTLVIIAIQFYKIDQYKNHDDRNTRVNRTKF